MKSDAGKRFAGKLARKMNAIQGATARGVEEATAIIAESCRDLAPRRTGGLVEAIQETEVEQQGDRVVAQVVARYEGVGSIEYGDRSRAADPFLRPGFDAAKDPARAAIARRIAAAS